MPTHRVKFGHGHALITDAGSYQPGDMPPPGNGYLEMHEWARVQMKAGLKQKMCGRCAKWKFQQELSDTIDRCEMKTNRGESVIVAERVCKSCDTKTPKGPQP